MEITIQAAAKMMKVGRSTIYKKISEGELSRCHSGKIETSELLRVFGSPTDRNTRHEEKTHIEDIKTLSKENTRHFQDTLQKEEFYKAQIQILQDNLSKAHERENQHLEREQWQRQHIEKLTDTIRLLEAPRRPGEPKQAEEPQEQPKAKQKGFFKWLF